MRYSYKKALETLTAYAYSEGYSHVSLEHKGISCMYWRPKTLNTPYKILIQSDKSLEIKSYLFLHELGHHELRKNWDEFELRMPTVAYAEYMAVNYKDYRYKRRKSYIVASLEEEYLAWDEALKLAETLGLWVDMDKWVELKSMCLKSYIVYYSTLKK